MKPDSHSTLLAIDTSSPACSVALSYHNTVYQQMEKEARKHTAELLPLIDTVLSVARIEKNTVEGIIISAGPGAFTGLRIGAAVAMGLSAAWNVPLLPISSLALLAATAIRITGKNKILALMDARMGEVYAGLYSGQNNIGDDRVCPPEQLPVNWFRDDTLAVGAGAIYAEHFPAPLPLKTDILPEAQDAFSLLKTTSWKNPGTGIELHYLRNEVTQS